MSLKADPKVKKVITVTAGQPVTIVKLTKSKLTLVKGKSAVVKASVGTSKASNKKVVWKSSNIKVAKVNSRGRITAAGGGSAVITAVAADGSGKKASCKVSVKAYVTSIKFKRAAVRCMWENRTVKPSHCTGRCNKQEVYLEVFE